MKRKQFVANFGRNRDPWLVTFGRRLRWELGCTFWFVLRWMIMVWFLKTFIFGSSYYMKLS